MRRYTAMLGCGYLSTTLSWYTQVVSSLCTITFSMPSLISNLTVTSIAMYRGTHVVYIYTQLLYCCPGYTCSIYIHSYSIAAQGTHVVCIYTVTLLLPIEIGVSIYIISIQAVKYHCIYIYGHIYKWEIFLLQVVSCV